MTEPKEFKNYSPGAVANYFLEKSWTEKRPLTPMHLQKLLYFANGWYMAFYNQDTRVVPLINEPFQSWEYGPVCASVYHEFKGFVTNPIPKNHLMKELVVSADLINVETEIKSIPSTDEKIKNLLDKVWETYFPLTALRLSGMTHVQDIDNPWRKAKKKAEAECIVRGKEINNEDIKNYFTKLSTEKRAY